MPTDNARRAKMDDSKKSNAVNAYHNISKHFPNRFADGPMYLDWKSQPEPFRTYEGAELFQKSA